METVVLGLGVAGFVIAIVAFGWREAMQLSVNPLGHRARSSESSEDKLLATLRGASGGHGARVGPYSRGEEESGVRFVVEGLCAKVTLRRTATAASHRDEVLETGDKEFDGAIEALGPPDQVHALLDAETRKALRELLGGTVRVGQLLLEGGELRVDVPTTGFAGEHPGLPQAAHAVAALSRRLAAPEPVRERLAANARHDPVAGVRLQSLLALVGLHPDDAFMAAELRAATSDRDAEVRLRAGIALGKDGREVLLALAADTAAEDRCSARAIEALGRDFPAEQARAQLARACRDARRAPLRPDSLRACIAVLGRRGGAEVTLINALDLGHEQVRVAVAEALGAVGSAAAVLPLKEAAERHGGALQSAARNAIAEIQSRLTGSPGELSLAEGEAGHVSLADDASGRVSLPGASPSRTDK
jgi:hypothetical protein